MKFHREWNGKFKTESTASMEFTGELIPVYGPGVAEPCMEIHSDPPLVGQLTGKNNTVAIISNGSSVLGMGSLGTDAVMPLLEGKAAFFSETVGLRAVPVPVATGSIDTFVNTVALLESSFGGVSIEAVSAHSTGKLETELRKKLKVPVIDDGPAGTACAVVAAVKNSLKLAEKSKEDAWITVSGGTPEGIFSAELLAKAGYQVLFCDKGNIVNDNNSTTPEFLRHVAELTNRNHLRGKLAKALKESDVAVLFTGAAGISQGDVGSMKEKPIVLALGSPVSEILPEPANGAGAFVAASSRLDYPNYVGSMLAFPGIFRGLMDAGVCEVTDGVLLAAADAIADSVTELTVDSVVPSPEEKSLHANVAEAVKKAAKNH